MALPSPTKTFHTQPYAAIDPSLPNLSSKSKNVLITGGGSGIGPIIAKAFAKSHASNIALLGRTEHTLLETKADIEKEYPETKVSTYVADITDAQALKAVFSTETKNVGAVNILVANAGYLPDIASIADSPFEEWFRGFEINVKGNFNLIQAFAAHAAKDAVVLNLTTAIVQFNAFAGYSAYHASKMAAAKLFDYVHLEYPDWFVLNIHPGVVPTAMSAKPGQMFPPTDDIQLPAHFAVWAASPEARFLNGKFVWAHWDVEELKAMADQIEGTDKFTLGLLGWL